MAKSNGEKLTTGFLCAVSAEFQERNAPGSNLYLSVRFSDDVYKFGPFKLRVALTRAYINVELDGCQLPPSPDLEQLWPDGLETRHQTKTTYSTSASETARISIGTTASANPSANASSDTANVEQNKNTIEHSREYSTSRKHVYWRGSSKRPSLIFDSRSAAEYLSGSLLAGQLIGSIEPNKALFSISLQLEIPKSGLVIEDGDQFVTYPNKRGLIKIIAARALCRNPAHLHSQSFYNGD